MSLPTYPGYKDSGVDWLGTVPEHWDSKRLKFLFDLVKREIREEDRIVTCFRDGAVTLRDNRRADGFTNALKEVGYQGIRVGDLVIHAMDAFAGAIGVSDSDGKSTPVYSVCTPVSPNVSSSYYARLLRNMAVAGFVSSLAKGIRERSTDFRWADAGEIFLPVPSETEQRNIVSFLDHETARIDALIEEQQRLIELLKEKRQTVISQAVTKGLDPTVPMRDSGVEWLGEVPAHWDVCALRRAIRSIEQGWSPECESYPADEDGWGVLKAGCVNRGVFDPFENKTLPPTLKPIAEYEVHAGDILMSRASGSPELVGSTALLGQVRERLMLSDKIFRVHLEEKISSHFFVWVMNAQFMRSQIEQALSGGNGLANNLPQSSLLAFWLAVPPDHEQDAIAELINEQTGRIDELIAEGDVAIELLQERRSALISAAVTGKIDVRGWQIPASAPSLELAQEAV